MNWGVQLSGRLIVVVKGDLEGEKIGGRLLPTGCPEALYILKEMVACTIVATNRKGEMNLTRND